MGQYILAEWYKLKKIQLLCIGLAFVALASFIGLGIYFANQAILVDGTQNEVMWGQLTFYYSQILYPPMLGIFMAITLNQEFERKNIEMLRANSISVKKLLFSKISVLIAIIILVQLLLFLVYIGGLLASDLGISVNLLLNLKWMALSVIASVAILCIQSYIFIKTRNFAQSIGFAALGSMGGFVLLFLNEKLVTLYPYSQPMIALRSRAIRDFTFNELMLFIIVNLTFSIIFYILSCRELEKNK